METTENNWVSIVEYSNRQGISISTIRRKIKNNKVKYTSISGKYYIYDDDYERPSQFDKNRLFLLEEENKHLKNKIKGHLEELNELKMLVKVYEETKS